MSREDEETFRRILAELRFLEGTAEALRSRINFVNAALSELAFTNQTLEGLEKESKNVSLLVPIGGGSFIKAKLESADKVLVGIGAGVTVEKTMKEAKEILKKRIEDLEKARMDLQQQITQIINRLQEDRNRLQELGEKLSARRKTSNVRKAEGRT